MPRFELALWHPLMSLDRIVQDVKLELKTGWSSGQSDDKAGTARDRTYARFILNESWVSPNFDLRQIIGHFSDLLLSEEFSDRGRAILYVTVEDDIEVLIGRTAMSLLSRLGVELALR